MDGELRYRDRRLLRPSSRRAARGERVEERLDATRKRSGGAIGIDAREARLLLAELREFLRGQACSPSERKLPVEIERTFVQSIASAKARRPIAYSIGHKEFSGLSLAFNPRCSSRGRDRAAFVSRAAARVSRHSATLVTVQRSDALAIKRHRPNSPWWQLDSTRAALV